ncbi:MAG: sulfotransferase [Nitrosomonas sp.]|nr:sulfotransferase [Nitrosomonas sp.]
MSANPIFIGGFRSGTTLLINLLGMHSNLAPWFETKSLCEALRWMHVIKNPANKNFENNYTTPAEATGFSQEAVRQRMLGHIEHTFARIDGAKPSGKAHHEKYPIGFDCIRYSKETACAALTDWAKTTSVKSDYDTVCHATRHLITTLGEKQCQAFNRPVWINKTPEIVRFSKELRDAMGPCKIIYLVRNGLNVVASARKLGWGNIESLAFNWKTLFEYTRDAMRDDSGNYLELRYEDLISNPQDTLDKVFAFCGQRLDGEGIVKSYRQHFSNNAFNLSRIETTGNLSPEDIIKFNAIAGKLQTELGYTS